MLSVKDIILHRNTQAIHLAIINLVEVLGLDRNIIEALVALLNCGKDKED